MGKMLKIKGLVHEYFRRGEKGEVIEINRALDGMDLEAEAGEFIAVLGHNGSGKSTFAKHLNALLLPTEGSVIIDSLDTSEPELCQTVRQKAGMVFQNPDNQLVSNVVEEDVAFGPENLAVPTEEIWERVDKALADVGMAAYRNHSPNRLSGGQKQRVAIAGVMAMRPKCMILDEATAMLDPQGRKAVLGLVKELNRKEKVTIILITHYMEEAVFADRVFVMDQGRVAMQGAPTEIFARPEKLNKLQLSVPQVTQLIQELRKKGMDIREDILTVEELVEELSVRLY